MIFINDKEVNFIYNLGQKVNEVFSYGTKIWPKEVLFDYMYFKLADGAESGNVSYQFSEYYNLHNKYLKISTDGSNWQDWTEQISMTPNTKYYVKGEDSYVRNSDISGGFFTSDVSTQNFNIECGGDVMSLCNMATEITVPYCLRSLFQKITNLVTAPKLPATTLKDNCYFGMFEGCSSLISTPELPATTLAVGCYEYMFQNCSSLTEVSRLPAMELKDKCYMCMFYSCSSLTQAPELPATTLSYCCYTGMFQGCSSLTKAPALPATTLAKECYRTMFNNCSSLTQAPELLATTLADYCYSYMFQGCSSLTQATELPATTLSYCCYTGMFYGCSSLTQAPKLPATTLVKECYRIMFQGCSSLTQAPALPATTLADYCYSYMFNNCTSLTQAPELPATTLANNCYNSMFYGSNKLNWIKALFTTTPSTSYTKNWVNGVSAQGVFVKNINATWTTTGVNAVPTGWTVIYYDQTEGKYFTTKTKEVECDKYGNVKQEIDAMYFKLADGYTSGNVSYKFDEYYNLHNKYLKISTDGNNWSDWTEQISMVQNVKYYVKGEDSYVRNSYAGASEFFTSDVSTQNFNIECGGNIMSLVNMNESITATGCFSGLFYNMINLVTPPQLPAISVPAYGYAVMFNNTKSLTSAPELPATTIGENAYRSMFYSSGINTAPNVLPSTTLAPSCYLSMFADCKNLTIAPSLPATTLADHCYDGMFKLSGITEAPELPATTLSSYCYNGMFQNCKSLTIAPVLTATTLADNCYRNMFYGCSGLTEITLNGDFNSSYANSWVRNVSPSGTFYNNSDLDIPVGVNGIPAGWKEIRPVKTDYMYFKLADGYTSGNVSYKFDEYFNLHNKYLKISTDGRNWQDWTEQISMSPNTKYFVKGEDNYVRNSSIGSGLFTSDVTESKFNIECGGNVMSLCNLATEITVPYCFMSLFKNMTNLVSVPELPVTTLADWCYSDMFVNCTSLTKAPELSATTLENYCYNKMFYGCTSLTQAPKLPATTLADYCYTSMFNGCKSLIEAPELPATTLANNCYVSMFQRCTSLIEIPELPATSLADYCYYSMFNGCTSLTQAPELPSTTMKIYCYTVMFSGCTSLTTAPELQATTLADYCYYGMFYGCKSLIEAPELPATVLASGCYRQMFYSANKLNWVKSMNTTTPSATYTPNWLNGVSAQGIFVKNINATWTNTGVDAVPTGWTVIYFDQTEGKYYTTQTKEVECDQYGNVKQEIDAMYFKLADGETSGNVSYQFAEYYNLHNKYLKISTDGSNWSDWTEQISMTPNTKYYVKGEDDYVRNSDISNGFFTSDVSQNNFNIECGGNVMSLVNMNESITVTNCFCSLFNDMKKLLTPPKLPATTLSDYCYNHMFSGCFSLTKAPELPATTLAEGCYYFMFFDCFKLVQAPELPATTLVNDCYSAMFYGSSKLNWIKALFTTKPGSPYTTSWVYGVSAQGVFVQNIDVTWKYTDSYSIPTGWKVIYFDTTNGKYYTTKTKEVECDKYGNPLV